MCSAACTRSQVQYFPRTMYTVCILLCFVVVWYRLIYPCHTEVLHWYWAWASYQIHNIVGCACAGNAWALPRYRLQRKPLVSDPGIHHGTCIKRVTWCMSRSLTRGSGGNFTGIPGACATRKFTYLARGPFGWLVPAKESWKLRINKSLFETWMLSKQNKEQQLWTYFVGHNALVWLTS